MSLKKYARWQKSSVKHALKIWRVVIISGPHQCEKTTLIKQIIKKNEIYRTLDDTELLNVAINDPMGFLKHSKGTMIIDEIQKAPLLLPAIKRIVDDNNLLAMIKRLSLIVRLRADIRRLLNYQIPIDTSGT